MKIFEALNAKPDGERLIQQLQNQIRPTALNKLVHVRDLFPRFTDHSISHCDGVVGILDWLMPDDVKKGLNEWELYFIIAAAYLHDIGMVEGCPGIPKGSEWEKYLIEYERFNEGKALEGELTIKQRAKRDFVRDYHHERSQEYIRDNWKELGLTVSDTVAEGQIAARIAAGHRKLDLGNKETFGEIPFGNNQLIRRDLLASYLRLADELDTTAHRTPLAEYEVIEFHDDDNILEWSKHLSISGVSTESGVIVIAGECRDHKLYLRLCILHEELRHKLNEIKRMLRKPYATGDGFSIEDPMPYHEIVLKVEHIGYLPINIKFELQDSEIAKLIMGERLYGDSKASIRELLQNSVDTCREAQEKMTSDWEARIEVREEDDGAVIIVEDNGMGMDEYIVRQYFAKIGFSYYQSSDFHGSFRPIGEFGIGILSCFMLAQQIEVESLKEGSEPIHLEINSLTEPFVPRKGSRTTPGTTVKLHLKKEMVGKIDILECVKYFGRHIEFNIKVVENNGKSYLVQDEGLMPSLEDFKALVGNKDAIGIKPIVSKRSISRYNATFRELGINVGVTLLDGPLPYWRFGYMGLSKSGKGRLCQNGFFVNDEENEFNKFAGMSWCEVDVKGDGKLGLTADRTRIAESKDQFWNKVSELYSKGIEKLIEKRHNIVTNKTWWNYHLDHYPDQLPKIPKALKAESLKNLEFCTFVNGEFRQTKLKEVKKWEGTIYGLGTDEHQHLLRFNKIIPEDVMIIIIPDKYFGTSNNRRWYVQLLERDDINIFQLAGKNIHYYSNEINGHRRFFIDVGVPLGVWRMSYSWIPRIVGMQNYNNTVYDAQHEYSEILRKRCSIILPGKSGFLIDEIFRTAHSLNPTKLFEKQTMAISELIKDGVITKEQYSGITKTIPVDEHTCAY